jgi:glycosyltransferase involved in cell wall biosynthesis
MSLLTNTADGRHPQDQKDVRSMAVCLVTEEISGIGGSGGIGAAFYELALVLAKNGARVDVLYCPVVPIAEEEKTQLRHRFSQHAIKLSFLNESEHVEGATSYEKRSYAVYRHLAGARQYDFVHFHDYKGLGFFSMKAKKQGRAFGTTTLVVQLHGPTRWTIEANGAFFVHEDQIKIDFLERSSIAEADYVVSPSAYLIEWLRDHDYQLPAGKRSLVIKNACGRLLNEIGERRQDNAVESRPVTDLVLFARHEDRKGFAIFCDALDLAEKAIKRKNITVSLLGKFGSVEGQPSGVYLIDRAKKWTFDVKVRTGLDRTGAAAYMSSLDNPVVVVPSPYENSPYTVLEVAAMGFPLISSTGGGGKELIAQPYPGLCDMTADMLAERIVDAVENGLEAPALAEGLHEIERKWLAFHAQSAHAAAAESVVQVQAQPTVALAITHFERPHKLVDALISAARQTYKNLEIIVVDDGSSSDATVAALQRIEVMAERLGARFIRRENGYLGAARNTAVAATDAEYICFLDDDDYAFPEMIEKMVAAATRSGADVTNCLNVYMAESDRGRIIASLDEGGHRPSYVPMGGPLALASLENCLGAATALIKTDSLRAIGGYTEIKGVGHEDYELFLRMLQAGYTIDILPEPLYFYEVGRPSMLSRTSMTRNFKRCFDAIEFGVNQAAASKDILSLALGKKLVIDVHNRQWWLYSLGPTAESRHQLMSHALTREERIRKLIALAQSEGSPKLSLAFAEDLQSSSAEDSDAVQVSSLISLGGPVARPTTAIAVFDPILVDVRADAELGRHQDALEGFGRYLDKTRAVSRVAIDIFAELLANAEGSVPRQEAAQWVKRLAGKAAQRDAMPRVGELMAFADVIDGRMDSSGHLGQLVEADEKQYLITNPDVSEAVAGGQFKSGYEHFSHFGSQEGRKGYLATQRLASLLRRYGVELDPAHIAAG